MGGRCKKRCYRSRKVAVAMWAKLYPFDQMDAYWCDRHKAWHIGHTDKWWWRRPPEDDPVAQQDSATTS